MRRDGGEAPLQAQRVGVVGVELHHLARLQSQLAPQPLRVGRCLGARRRQHLRVVERASERRRRNIGDARRLVRTKGRAAAAAAALVDELVEEGPERRAVDTREPREEEHVAVVDGWSGRETICSEGSGEEQEEEDEGGGRRRHNLARSSPSVHIVTGAA